MIHEECLAWRLQTVTVLLSFSVIVLEYWLNQLKGEGDYLDLQFQAIVHRGRETTVELIPLHLCNQEAENDQWMPGLSLLSPVQDVLPSNSPAPSQDGASCINKIGHTHRHTQRFIPYVTLEPVTMTPWQLLYPASTDLFHSVSIPCISYICVYVFLLHSVPVITMIILHVCNSC